MMATTLGQNQVRDVLAWNFDFEFNALQSAAACEGAVIGVTMDYPGINRECAQWWGKDDRVMHYASLLNAEAPQPTRVNIAVACPAPATQHADEAADMMITGIWTFSLDVEHNKQWNLQWQTSSLQGVAPSTLGASLAASPLVGAGAPNWLPFSSFYDLGHLLKFIQADPASLPADLATFDAWLLAWFPKHSELKDWLPHTDFESARQKFNSHHRSRLQVDIGSDVSLMLALFEEWVPKANRAALFSKAAITASAAAAVAGLCPSAPPGLSAPPTPPPGLPVAPRGSLSVQAPKVASWGCSARQAMESANVDEGKGERLAKAIALKKAMSTRAGTRNCPNSAWGCSYRDKVLAATVKVEKLGSIAESKSVSKEAVAKTFPRKVGNDSVATWQFRAGKDQAKFPRPAAAAA